MNCAEIETHEHRGDFREWMSITEPDDNGNCDLCDVAPLNSANKLREFILVLFGKFLEGSLRSRSHSGSSQSSAGVSLQVEGIARTMLGEWRPRFRQQPFHARARQRETAELFTVFSTV